MQEIKKKESVKYSKEVFGLKTSSVLTTDTEIWKTGKEAYMGLGEKIGDNESVLSIAT